jgi:hypothetical protein
VHSKGLIIDVVKNYINLNLNSKLSNEIALNTALYPMAQIVNSWIQTDHAYIGVNSNFEICFEIKSHIAELALNLSMTIESALGQTIFNSLSHSFKTEIGTKILVCKIPKDLLNNGLFSVTIVLAINRSSAIQTVKEILTFEVMDNRENEAWYGDISHHLIRPKLNWYFI